MSKRPERIPIPSEIEAEMRLAVKAFVNSLIDQIQSLTEKVERLEKQVEKLTPRNSSLPPSSEHPHAKPKPAAKGGKKRKRGGQKGHKRHQRDLVPPDQCNSVTPCYPEACRRCGGVLEIDPSEPQRHQVWELPPIQPIIDEYQLFRGNCPCCGITTQASLPDGVPTGQCGPRLAAFTELLMGHFRQSKRRAASFLGDLLNIPASPGWVVKIQNHVSQAIASPYEELRDHLAEQEQLFVDESPTKEKGQSAWLWVAVAPLFAVFGSFGNRKRESLTKLIGDYRGIILNCDRAKMYLDGERLQWCWAHLKRDFQKLIDSHDGKVRRMGHDLMRLHRELFDYWRQYKAGKIKWRTFQSYVSPIRSQFRGLLLRGKYSGNARLRGFCEELDARREHLWTFTRVPGIEPTNNTAERALRPAVIYRKLSFGTQSVSGSRYLERILTVSETCRMQNRNTFAYLVRAMEAQFAGQQIPSLMPPRQINTDAA
jgi:transposase